ncbi:acyl-CoA thioesterase domain-containing protein [Streptomyces sp. NPDC018045]|uniref:acyl-CoA thioesterase domain-containing protein n=1 Tax=Streptomyces sp. NPDC018045 TaxID=3365037 RepID=UPI00379F695E
MSDLRPTEPEEENQAFHRNLGDGRYDSSAATAGPWSAGTQHAGPPSALLGRALEEGGAREGFRITRVTVDLPRPVPSRNCTSKYAPSAPVRAQSWSKAN